MKVFAFLIITVASVVAEGSGPYLPSGWKPDGPAFYLPSEIVKISANPITDSILDGSDASGSNALLEYGPPAISSQDVVEQNQESGDQIHQNLTSDLDNTAASGSDFLREYGPPSLSQNIINQGLPDEVTEQNFGIALKVVVSEDKVEVSSEQEAVTESAEQTTLAINNIDLPMIDDKEIKSQETSESTEASPAETQFENVLSEEIVDVSEISEAVAQTTESASQDVTSVSNADLSAQNIPDVAQLESEVISEQVELKNVSNQTPFGLLEQAPAGFLEYGPPGFTEYGPPKEDLISIESNAARRRRFSPKFRSSRKH